MIPPEAIDRLRQAVDIVQVVSRQVRLKRSGANWKGLCPFHQEKTPSFTVHSAKQIFHCFGCGEGGDVFTFEMKTQGLGFSEAARLLAAEVGMELPDAAGAEAKEAKQEAQQRQALLELLHLACLWFRRNLQDSAEGTEARDYACSRGLSETTLERFQIGYAPSDPQALERAAIKKGFTLAQLLEVGLLSQVEGRVYARFRGRLVFPIQDEKGRVVGFGGRLLSQGEPKYLNSPESKLFHKGRLLYALPQACQAIKKKIVSWSAKAIWTLWPAIKQA